LERCLAARALRCGAFRSVALGCGAFRHIALMHDAALCIAVLCGALLSCGALRYLAVLGGALWSFAMPCSWCLVRCFAARQWFAAVLCGGALRLQWLAVPNTALALRCFGFAVLWFAVLWLCCALALRCFGFAVLRGIALQCSALGRCLAGSA
jgi:hypothetical protein